MSKTYTRQPMNAADWMSRIVLVISGTFLLGGAFALINMPRANGFPRLEQRGPNGAFQIVNEPESDLPDLEAMPEPEVQDIEEVSAKRRFPILIQQGPHGAYHILNKKGVGGPERGEYKGFPKLEQRGPHGAYHMMNE